MHEADASSASLRAPEEKQKSPWVFRVLALSCLTLLLGNIPMQSHLVASAKTDIPIFEIVTTKPSSNLNSVETPIQSFSENDIAENNLHIIDVENELFGAQELSLPTRANETYVGHIKNKSDSKWTTYQVKSYDNLTNIFHKLGHQAALKTIQKNNAL